MVQITASSGTKTRSYIFKAISRQKQRLRPLRYDLPFWHCWKHQNNSLHRHRYSLSIFKLHSLFLTALLFIVYWFISHWNQSGGIPFECMTLECHQRLQALETKLQLEEDLYQNMFRKEQKRTVQSMARKKVHRKEFIVRERLRQIDLDARENFKEHPQTARRYPPRPEWIGKSYPEINIAGNLKTGTSQLYNIFASHPGVYHPEDDDKEHCSSDYTSDDDDADSNNTYEFGLFSWHKYYFSHQTSGKKRLNGCLIQSNNERQFSYNPPTLSGKEKFFILLRDPADWAWAAYNFWCDTAWEHVDPDDRYWVKATKHYRSPEVFHELMLSGGKLRGNDILEELRENSVWNLRRLKAMVGEENLVILKNEDMSPDRVESSGFLDRLEEATGLSKDGFDSSTLHSKSNCNGQKGYFTKCEDNPLSGQNKQGYPVTNDRPMLEATRRFVYLQWHAECRIWAEEFGIVYDDCLAAIPDDEAVNHHALVPNNALQQ